MKIKLVQKANITIQGITEAEKALYVQTQGWKYIPSTYALVVEYNHHCLLVKLSINSKTGKIVSKRILKLI